MGQVHQLSDRLQFQKNLIELLSNLANLKLFQLLRGQQEVTPHLAAKLAPRNIPPIVFLSSDPKG